MVAYKGLYEASRQSDIVVFVCGTHVTDQAVLQRYDPTVDLGNAANALRTGIARTGLPAIHIRIQREE